jgi:hypothetical protein
MNYAVSLDKSKKGPVLKGSLFETEKYSGTLGIIET